MTENKLDYTNGINKADKRTGFFGYFYAILPVLVFLSPFAVLDKSLLVRRTKSIPKPIQYFQTGSRQSSEVKSGKVSVLVARNTIISNSEQGLIGYGRELIVHTASYFGPHGSVAQTTNGMNCSNCHLDAGTRPFANSFVDFMSTYPKYSARRGCKINVEDRLSECFERSLNGFAPAKNTKEIKAILAYMNWVGKSENNNPKTPTTGVEKLPFLPRAADPVAGKSVYIAKCQVCHGDHGQGTFAADHINYQYPPLWGKHSYNDGAGMARLINFAGFVKNNMPFGATKAHPVLTNQLAWDVAAFVNSQPRPHRDQRYDYPKKDEKPIDLPVPPFSDGFSARQHKFGPFTVISLVHQKQKL